MSPFQVDLTSEDTLAEIFESRQEVLADLGQHRDLLSRFWDSAGLIHRTHSSAGSGHATSTAFSLFQVLDGGSQPAIANSHAGLSGDQIALALQRLGEALTDGHPAAGPSSQATSTGTLPNQYNSSIQLAGYLCGVNATSTVPSVEVTLACRRIASWLMDQFLKTRGWLTRLENDAPSSYLTYWSATALSQWKAVSAVCEIDKHECDRVDQILAQVGEWGEVETARSIAHHYAGMKSKFDVIELLFSCACALRFRAGPSARQLAGHAYEIVFSGYFADGCFAPSAPVIADQENFALQCPTAEALAQLLAVDPLPLIPYWSALCTTHAWLRRNARGNEGWVSEHLGQYSNPTSFMAASGVLFLTKLAALLDDALSEGAARLLRLAPLVPEDWLLGFEYPGDLGTVLQQHVIGPLSTAPAASDLASYSLILYGPPGTAKTTVAKKLACDLSWPLLVVNQSAFLRQGVGNIDAEADRLFRVIAYLRNVVVLFDEIEELVHDRDTSDRASRLLTTSMLPRIHALRDSRRVVFIFATNHEERLDDAASRLGRFDIIRAVMPPDTAERAGMLTTLVKKFKLQALLDGEIAQLAERAENFSYMDLFGLVRHLAIATQGKDAMEAHVLDRAIEVYSKRVTNKQFHEMVGRITESQKRLDRP